MEPVQLYENEIRPKLSSHLSTILSSLSPIEKGDRYELSCPSCNNRTAYIYKNSDWISCNKKNSCGYGEYITTYLNGGIKASHSAYINVIKQLCEIVGVPFPERDWQPQEVERYEKKERKKQLWASFQAITRQLLHDDSDKSGLNYLKEKRGYTDQIIDQSEFGFYPSNGCTNTESGVGLIKNELQKLGYTSDEIKASGVCRSDWNNRIVHPERDDHHKITTFWARDITGKVPNDYKCTYLSKESGASLAVPFGLHEARERDLIVVEGGFDRLTLAAHGIGNVIALGGSRISEEHIKALHKAKIKSVTLFLDNDPAGIEGRRLTINRLTNDSIYVFVVPEVLMDSLKDPDEYLRQEGADSAKKLIGNRISFGAYMAYCIINKHKKNNLLGSFEKLSVLEEAKSFASSIHNDSKKLANEEFWETIYNEADITEETLIQYQNEAQEKKEKIAQEEAIEKAKKSINDIDINSPESAIDEFVRIAEELKIRKIASKPIITASSSLENHDKMLAERWTQEFIGLPQRTLSELDDRLLGLRLFMLLAAAPNVGKTALAIQLAVDILRSNKNTCLLFVSLEMSTNEILSRVRCMLANLEYRRLMKGFFTNEEKVRFDKASAILKEFNDRFEFIDSETYPDITFDELKAKINDIKKRTGCKHVMVVIDYLQVWPIPNEIRKLHSSENELDRWRIEELKMIKKYLNNDPLLVISEARKPSGQNKWGSGLQDVMGSSRGAYGPDVVLLYWPLEDKELAEAWKNHLKLSPDSFAVLTKQKHTDKDEEMGKIIREFYAQRNEAIVYLCVEKGRDGMRKGLMTLKYNFEKNTYEEISWAIEAASIKLQSKIIENSSQEDLEKGKHLPASKTTSDLGWYA